MPAQPEFAPVFQELREILAEYAPRLKVVHDRPDYYYLDTHQMGANKRPISFGGVKIGKAYVSYYLMPAYAALGEISPDLKKRMQGKACFNFTTVDQKLFKELRQVTKTGYQSWKKLKWVD